MGIRLVVEVFDHAPKLTDRELRVLTLFAESARDETRLCFPGLEDDGPFVARMRLSRTQRYAVVKSLVDKGALLRISRGRQGARAVFAIPHFAPASASVQAAPAGPDEPEIRVPESGTEAVPEGPEIRDERVPETGIEGPEIRDPFSSVSPQIPSSLSSPERKILAVGATTEETREIISIIQTENRPRSLAAYVRAMPADDLAALLDRVRSGLHRLPASPSGPLSYADQASRQPCAHGRPGGNVPRGEAGPACPHCRRGILATADQAPSPGREASIAAVRARLSRPQPCTRAESATVAGSPAARGRETAGQTRLARTTMS